MKMKYLPLVLISVAVQVALAANPTRCQVQNFVPDALHWGPQAMQHADNLRTTTVKSSFVASGSEEDCDYVINRDCTAEPFHNTDIVWCSSHYYCAFFPALHVLQERYITCTYRCNNGTTYTMEHYDTRVSIQGCCSFIPSGDDNENKENH